MAKEDYYATLGVGREATDAELKSAYRKAAMKCHPDRHPGDKDAEERFKKLNEAYEVLKDPQKRAAYDRFGHAAFEQGGMGPGGFGGDFSGSMADIFDDLFGDLMGGGRRRQQQGGRARGSDLRYNLEITLEEAFKGKHAEIRIPTRVACDACGGTGAKAGTKPKTCSTCSGTGRIRASQGFFTLERTCHVCEGRGEIIEDPCPSCKGQGAVMRDRTLAVNIPAGVDEGTRIRLAGEGEAGSRGGPAGDLYIFVSIRSHPMFQRDDANLYCRVPVSMVTASLGGQVEVPTLEGSRIKVTIPEGTQSGHQLRLRGKGMPVLRGRDFGDMFVEVRVETPRNLTKKQKELLQEFEKESSNDTHPESAGFFSRVKEFFDGLS